MSARARTAAPTPYAALWHAALWHAAAPRGKREPRQRTTRGGGAVAATVRWAGKEAAPCLQEDQLGPRIESAEFLVLFDTQPELPAGSQPIRLWWRILARLPRFRSSETPAVPRVSGQNLSRPQSPPANTALLPPPESLTTAGPWCPRLPRARPPTPPSLPTETNPRGGCCIHPAWLAQKDSRPRLALNSRGRPTPDTVSSVGLTHQAAAAAPCRARAPQPGPCSIRRSEIPFFLLHEIFLLKYFESITRAVGLLSAHSPMLCRALPKPTVW